MRLPFRCYLRDDKVAACEMVVSLTESDNADFSSRIIIRHYILFIAGNIGNGSWQLPDIRSHQIIRTFVEIITTLYFAVN